MKALRLKTHHFHTKLPYQKAMLRQIEWWVHNGPNTKNSVLPVIKLFLWKFCFSLRTSYKKLIWCTNNLNAHIRTFSMRCSFIWRGFFPVSILKTTSVWSFVVVYDSVFLSKLSLRGYYGKTDHWFRKQKIPQILEIP